MRLILVLALFTLLPSFLASQTKSLELKVAVINGKGGEESHAPILLNGYRATIDGATIHYHSSYPDAEDALIIRANAEAHAATWETDTIPHDYDRDTVTFLWLAGLERSGWGESTTGHQFTLSVNGEPYFTFRNFKDSTDKHWRVTGKNGAKLSFDWEKSDKFGDLFGTIHLSIPKKYCPDGKPLTLRVEGELAGSPEWYMTFQYRFSFTPRLTVEPALFRNSDGATQVLRLSLDNLVPGREVDITSLGAQAAAGKPKIAPTVLHERLDVGPHAWMLPIPAVDSTLPLTLRFLLDGKETLRRTIAIKPVVKRELYLLSHSHNDIGYTDLQTVVQQKQWHNIDEALRLIDATRDYPIDARFHWNIEVLWPLESYLRNATADKKEELLAAIRNGYIGVNALYANELTGLATSVEMSHFTDYAREFSKEYSISITTALMSDIPGFTWGIVPALAQSGVKYFASGPNSGDRIGYVLQQWGDKPFYWASQSGEEKVLFWVAGAGYSTFHEGTLEKLGEERLMKLVRRLDETGYPYDIVQLPYTLGDNGPPDSTLSDFVRKWNDKYLSPHLVLSTHAQMFEEFAQRHGHELPVYGGDFTPYWEDGALSTAYETALNRSAVDRLVQGEALWSMRNPKEFPTSAYDTAWRNVSLWDEHTWGADKSIDAPDDPGVIGQWNIKRRFALNADSLSRALLDLANPPSGKEGVIDVYNTSSWERTEIVRVPADLSKEVQKVVDERGKPVTSQRLSTGELALLVDKIAPFSSRRFALKTGKGIDSSASGAPLVLENALLRLSVNEATGTIDELQWKSGKIDFASASNGLNRYLYVRGTNGDSAVTLSNVRVTRKESGPLVQSILVQADAPGCRSYTSEIRLAEGSDRVEIVTTVDKLPVREKEGMHFAFPFDVKDGEVTYDVANGIVEPDSSQLPGSCKNFFSVQSWVDVSNESSGMTMATPDAPLIEIGGITAEKPWMKSAVHSSTVLSYAMNNYWHTNYKADQEGKTVFRYVLMPHAAFDPGAAAKFGRECRAPLIVRPASGAVPLPQLFHLEPATVIVESVRPLPDGAGWLLYFSNPTAEDQSVRIHWNAKERVTFSSSDAAGDHGGDLHDMLIVRAFGSGYVRADLR